MGGVCASGAPVMGAGGRLAAGVLPEAHGWLVVPVLSDADQDPGVRGARVPSRVLLHLPPREAAVHGGVPGLGRRGRSLEDDPVGIAASGRRVYLLAGATADETGSRRSTVRSIEAWPTAVPANWSDRPSGRMESLPPLIIEGEVIGFAGTDAGPAALVADPVSPDDPGSTGALRLARFLDGSWAIEPLPAFEWGHNDPPVLLGSPSRLAVVGRSRTIIGSGTADGWRRADFALEPGESAIGLIGERVITWKALAHGGGEVVVSLVGMQGRAEIARLALPADPAFVGAVVLPDQNGRLIVVVGESARGEPGAGGAATGEEGSESPIRYGLTEISLSTGDLLYSGPIDRVAPVTREEFLILAVSLILMMVVSLIVVLSPVPAESELTVPAGCALATPGRRFAATVLDTALCTLVVSRISGVPFSEIIGLEVLIATDRSWLTLPGVLLVGLIYATLTETFFAGTFGKLALGCRVVRVSADGGPPVRPGFVRTLIRNAVKWIIPPAASLALIEPTGRHRGDFLAGVLVVTPIGDEPADGGSGDGATEPEDRPGDG